ncbi:O-antigen polymerase [Pontiella sulfatireligans]|uniref:Oligosaccharide repeat unit polymerase n=1 Tax=Pontiella sulfatireligans TaxID=2750658 RepID=A0A6C2URW9_9BACT|nr:O-antigen polymerase [Pontiella sulfatireligans]VGO21676.1 hypothetical protein SCARR_03750 [Pontiella sulfatireligans]
MNLIALVLYGLVNGAMVGVHLLKKNRVYEFPFWAGALSLGWFFPMAIGGFVNAKMYPDAAYSTGMIFASLCSIALWVGFSKAIKERPPKVSWLDAQFDRDKLFVAGAALSVMGFYFLWKLNNLPEEMLRQTQWSGATVKYLFLGSIAVIGALVLWILYLDQDKILAPKLLLFIAPTFLSLLQAAVGGRRGVMMNLAAYIFVTLWFVKRIILPRWLLFSGVLFGLALVNSIESYRIIMSKKNVSLSERLKETSRIDFTSGSKGAMKSVAGDFSNYIFLRQVVAEDFQLDFGLSHWNGMIFNFVPGQWVGKDLKKALMVNTEYNAFSVVSERYGHHFGVGTVTTGYYDAFASFGWLGFFKFWLIGWMMGTLYRNGMNGSFLGILLYVYMLSSGMHAISHGTHAVLVSNWIYFLVLGYPVIHYAKIDQETETQALYQKC